MERKRNWKKRLMALFMALLIIGGSVIPTAYDLVSLAEGQESGRDVSGDDAGASSGVGIDVTSEIRIEGGKDHVLAGESFEFVIHYNLPELSSEQGSVYSNGRVTLMLPQYVQLAQEADGSYLVSGDEVVSVTQDPVVSSRYTITLDEELDINAGHDIVIRFKTENLKTPNCTLNLGGENFKFSVGYLGQGGHPENEEFIVPAQSVEVKADSEWQMEKNIVSSDPNSDVSYVLDAEKQNFSVTYQIKVNETKEVNRLGRLGFKSYALKDTLPSEGLPEDGEALEINNVQLVHGSERIHLDTDDYEVEYDAEKHPVSITFHTMDTVREGEAGQFQQVGDVTNTIYEYTVVYPYEPYVTKIIEQYMKKYTLTNTANLSYTLLGGINGGNQDTASFDIAAFESDVVFADIKIKKQIQIGNENRDLDQQLSEIYGKAKFTLYTDQACTNVAYNIVRDQMSDIETDDSGIATFSDIREGTYFIKEEKLPGFKETDVIPVTVNQDGTVSFNNEGTASSNPYLVVNEAESVGILEFTKTGVDAEGKQDDKLAGAEFTLTDVDGQKHTAVSDENGTVRFENLPAGEYLLKETAVSAAMA